MTLRQLYYENLKKNKYHEDVAQLNLIELLSQYQQRIESTNLLSRFFSFQPSEKNGVYIWGKVGGGKTFIVDLFFQNLNTQHKCKQHFHQFMLNFHNKLNTLRQQKLSSNIINILVKKFYAKYKVLYLDEFQINNIADAMLLSSLLKAFIKFKIHIFLTSNTPPQDIYKNGLKREYILPFIDLLHQKMNIYDLNNSKDYRKEKLKGSQSFFLYPYSNEKNKEKLNLLINSLVNGNIFTESHITITKNRKLVIKNALGNIAKFTFEEICLSNVGAIDYIALCIQFSILIIEDIPQLKPENHNEALRFITLIDCMYDNKVIGIFSAETELEKLYIGTIHHKEFKRTISRIYEMQSSEYIDRGKCSTFLKNL